MECKHKKDMTLSVDRWNAGTGIGKEEGGGEGREQTYDLRGPASQDCAPREGPGPLPEGPGLLRIALLPRRIASRNWLEG